MAHQKAVPMEAIKNVTKFAGKHKFLVIGGGALAAGAGFLYLRSRGASEEPSDAGVAYTGGYMPIGTPMSSAPLGAGAITPPVMPGSGGGTLLPGGEVAGANGRPTATYQGAFGSYEGIAADLAATLDLARQNLEYGYNQQVVQSTFDYDAALASMNLSAYTSSLAYGSNAAATNASLIQSGIDRGFDYAQLVDWAQGLFTLNPTSPYASYNAPAYAQYPATFGTGNSQGNPAADPNRSNMSPNQTLPVWPTTVAQATATIAPPAPAAPVNHAAQYLQNNPDVASAYAVEAARGNAAKMGIFSAEQYAEYHHNTYGATEGRAW